MAEWSAVCCSAGAAAVVTTVSSVMAMASWVGACSARVMTAGKVCGAARTCADGSAGIGTSDSSSGVQRTAVYVSGAPSRSTTWYSSTL